MFWGKESSQNCKESMSTEFEMKIVFPDSKTRRGPESEGA